MLDYWRKVCYTLLIEQITKTAEKGGFLLNNRDQFKRILNYLSALVIICAFMRLTCMPVKFKMSASITDS